MPTGGPGGGLARQTIQTHNRVGRRQEEKTTTLSLALPGGQELLTLRIACPS